MSEPQYDNNQHGHFNLMHEDRRGAMYRGGAERDEVFTSYALSFVAQAIFLAGFVLLASLLKAFNVHLGDVISEMAVNRTFLLLALVAIAYVGCMSFVVILAQRIGLR